MYCYYRLSCHHNGSVSRCTPEDLNMVLAQTSDAVIHHTHQMPINLMQILAILSKGILKHKQAAGDTLTAAGINWKSTKS